MPRRLRIGLLTGGGDCPGMNAVIRAVTKSLILQANAEVIGFEDGYEGLIEGRFRTLEFQDVSGILTRGGTILGTSNRANPFRYYRRGEADVSAEVIALYRELELDGIVAIGGDGTMTIAHGLSERGLRFIGVPKTIDNDIWGTERTFGFDTAVHIATEAIDRLHTTAQSHHRVMICETMGRYAGWIALYAGVAAGADVILIPELPFDVEVVAEVCRERESDGHRFTIIVVAEGARPEGGTFHVRERVPESPDPIRLGGIGYELERQLRDRLRSEVRTTVLGHVQRGGTPTAYDRSLASAFGAYAAALVQAEQYGCMVALRDGRLTTVPLAEVAGRTRTVPLDHPMLGAALAVGTSLGVRALTSPLVGAEPTTPLA
ncbi:6-phosphofructokinase [Rhodothermus marinus]|uniref:ATP-dependent 6-phosphofructokinase n=1 Tax=Rhodothermus marinus (strain ATCC 43812 / DSM 4252 / R-10) TaxID=518766 RepID=D0MDK8_RHOM4|nr:ATP-dependent 6-phosphofructokinase [Rhodothermus marinus]ACY47201.1 phosphofructokinase [Rhodothermus marinus DSM 4252]